MCTVVNGFEEPKPIVAAGAGRGSRKALTNHRSAAAE
jgi:hypothetical protein